MADIRYYDVILKPIVTEKSMNAMSEKKNTHLWFTPEANKSQIKEAVEKMFEGTKVKKRKHHEHGRKEQTSWNGSWKKTAKSKKAIVALTEDSKDIEIFEGL